jgi:beta-mannosidase
MPPILILTWALCQLGFSGQPLLVADAVDGPAWVRYKPMGGASWDTLGLVPGPFVRMEFELPSGTQAGDSVSYAFPDPVEFAAQRQRAEPLPYPTDNDPQRLSQHLRKPAVEFGWDFARRSVRTGAPAPSLGHPQGPMARPLIYVEWVPRPAGGRTKFAPQHRWALTHSRLVTDDPARPFYLEINGRPQFVLGVNAVVPSDPALEDRLRLRLIEMWRAGGNTVRFWAGGTYPSERLLRTCDSLGLMVWQDFAFTGTAYPGDSTFRAWVRAEAEYQVKRMAEHPSVVLFCGNNEIDVAWRAWGWQKTYGMSPADSTQLWANNHWIFDELLPSVVAAHAPGRAYLASSPVSNWGRPEDFTRGDNHDWRVWHGEQPTSVLAERVAPLVSEWGVPSLPGPSVRARWTAEPVTYMLSYKGLELLERYLRSEQAWRGGTTGALADASQRWQSKVIRRTLRAQRRARPLCSGTLIWQLNDLDDAITWSLIDRDDVPKRAWSATLREFRKF